MAQQSIPGLVLPRSRIPLPRTAPPRLVLLINESVVVIKQSYVVTETRVDNNLKQAKLIAVIDNHIHNHA